MVVCFKVKCACLLALVGISCASEQQRRSLQQAPPPPYLFGSAIAAYQVEGATFEGGRGLSIWDTWSSIPGKILDGDTADVADDFYHRYLSDIEIMTELGIETFRFSLSWPRILPNGTGQVNQAGIDFYNSLIDALIAANIEPFITIYHWDTPQVLQDAYGSWLDYQIVYDFAEFAAIAFSEFGDRVRYWATLNEPSSIKTGWYLGTYPPGRCTNRSVCAAGSDAEQWLVDYHMLNAHALAVSHFRDIVPDGKITMTVSVSTPVAATNSSEDKAAAEKYWQDYLGIYADPLYFGDWPQRLKDTLGSALPSFTPAESKLLKGSSDYFALQYYHSVYAYATSWSPGYRISFTDPQGNLIGPTAGIEWLHSYPEGLKLYIAYVEDRYNPGEIIITENGASTPKLDKHSTIQQGIQDNYTVAYYQVHLNALNQAIANGANVTRYYAWSLLDNFEWNYGYSQRFGLAFVDYATQQRAIKASGIWLKNYFATSANLTYTQAVSAANTSLTNQSPSQPASAG